MQEDTQEDTQDDMQENKAKRNTQTLQKWDSSKSRGSKPSDCARNIYKNNTQGILKFAVVFCGDINKIVTESKFSLTTTTDRKWEKFQETLQEDGVTYKITGHVLTRASTEDCNDFVTNQFASCKLSNKIITGNGATAFETVLKLEPTHQNFNPLKHSTSPVIPLPSEEQSWSRDCYRLKNEATDFQNFYLVKKWKPSQNPPALEADKYPFLYIFDTQKPHTLLWNLWSQQKFQTKAGLELDKANKLTAILFYIIKTRLSSLFLVPALLHTDMNEDTDQDMNEDTFDRIEDNMGATHITPLIPSDVWTLGEFLLKSVPLFCGAYFDSGVQFDEQAAAVAYQLQESNLQIEAFKDTKRNEPDVLSVGLVDQLQLYKSTPQPKISLPMLASWCQRLELLCNAGKQGIKGTEYRGTYAAGKKDITIATTFDYNLIEKTAKAFNISFSKDEIPGNSKIRLTGPMTHSNINLKTLGFATVDTNEFMKDSGVSTKNSDRLPPSAFETFLCEPSAVVFTTAPLKNILPNTTEILSPELVLPFARMRVLDAIETATNTNTENFENIDLPEPLKNAVSWLEKEEALNFLQRAQELLDEAHNQTTKTNYGNLWYKVRTQKDNFLETDSVFQFALAAVQVLTHPKQVETYYAKKEPENQLFHFVTNMHKSIDYFKADKSLNFVMTDANLIEYCTERGSKNLDQTAQTIAKTVFTESLKHCHSIMSNFKKGYKYAFREQAGTDTNTQVIAELAHSHEQSDTPDYVLQIKHGSSVTAQCESDGQQNKPDVVQQITVNYLKEDSFNRLCEILEQAINIELKKHTSRPTFEDFTDALLDVMALEEFRGGFVFGMADGPRHTNDNDDNKIDLPYKNIFEQRFEAHKNRYNFNRSKTLRDQKNFLRFVDGTVFPVTHTIEEKL